MTDVVFDIIQKRPSKGFAPGEILEQPKARRISAPSFPYLQLYKLKRGGEIIEKNGRYYPRSGKP
jgi:hypothetical protein